MIPPRPPSQVHRLPAQVSYHPDVLDASLAPRSAPAAGGEFNFAHLERIMTTAFTAAIHANKPPATAFPPNMWSPDGVPLNVNPAIENKGRLKINPMPNQSMVQLLGINLRSNWSIEGNREALDVSKLTRHMTSG